MNNWVKKYRAILIIALVFILGLSLGNSFGSKPATIIVQDSGVININNASTTPDVDMTAFWKVWDLLSEKYVVTHGTTTVSSDDRIYGAIQGLTDSLGDPYTVFMPPTEKKDFEDGLSGNFEGIGMEIAVKDKTLSVVTPIKGSPAEKAGIKSGDKVIMIDGKSALNLSVDEAIKLIRGPKGTVVKLTFARVGESKPVEVSVIRDIINSPSLKTEVKGDVFVISLYNFYGDSKQQFKEALKEFIKSKKYRLVIDLRGNPGGYLDSAVDLASWFLPLGKVIVREDFGAKSGQPEKVYRSKGYDIFTDSLRLAILIDNGSASASEILAGALQENGKAKLVGVKSFGKGSVQQLIDVTDDTALKVTVARWLTPTGKSISDNGLTPDYVVKITEQDIKTEKDPQMEKAIEILK